jgi:large subunit ribosomal protein L23
MDLSNILKKPLITEKTIKLTEDSKFTFIVDVRATKKTVKKAVEKFFTVDVENVWIIKIKGKTIRVGRFKRKTSQKPDFKKAIVKLKKGQTIDLFALEGK